MATNVEFLEE